MSCQWCSSGGYWECDGEGGCGQPVAGGRIVGRVPPEPAPDWDVEHPAVEIRYFDGPPVEKQGGGQITVHLRGTPLPHLVVELNGHEVEGADDPATCGTRAPQGPTASREWEMNRVVTLREPGPTGPVIKDDDGNDVRVRVQAYRYRGTGSGHPAGIGPKVRIYALVPGEDECDQH